MNNKEENFVSAVIYVHNAADRIQPFLSSIIGILQNNFNHSEIVCVNDSSDDDSVSIIKEMADKVANTSISIINMSYYHGLELAMNAGVDLSIGDFVFEFDNTVLDFDSNEVMNVYNRSLEGYDIVSASPLKKQKKTSSLFYYIFEIFTNYTYEMSTESFRVLSRRVINRISSMNKTVPYRKAVYANCGLRTDNIKYTITANQAPNIDRNEKKYRASLAADSLILFTNLGYRFAIAMTFLMILTTVFMVGYSLIVYILGTPVAGWTTTILFLSFCFFGLFAILTIVIKYLQIIIDLVFKRKKYSFESIEKLTK